MSDPLPAELSERPVPEEPEPGSAVARRRSERWIALSSRAGVWGFVLGFLPMIGGALGLPVGMGLAMTVLGGGLMVSGAGTAAASFLVLRRAPSGARLMRATAFLGIPLGAMMAVVGLNTLAGVEIIPALTPLLIPILGLAVLLLGLVVFVVYGGREADGADGEDGATLPRA